MSLLLIVPFVLMLLAIALLPLVAMHWWEPNANKARHTVSRSARPRLANSS